MLTPSFFCLQEMHAAYWSCVVCVCVICKISHTHTHTHTRTHTHVPTGLLQGTHTFITHFLPLHPLQLWTQLKKKPVSVVRNAHGKLAQKAGFGASISAGGCALMFTEQHLETEHVQNNKITELGCQGFSTVSCLICRVGQIRMYTLFLTV